MLLALFTNLGLAMKFVFDIINRLTLVLAIPFTFSQVAVAADNSVARLNAAGLSKRGHCTATLVSKTMAVTARHCVTKNRRDQLHLVFGYEKNNWVEHRKVAKINLHKSRDIAWLCLDKPSKQKPVKVAGPAKISGHQLTVTGYPRSRPHKQLTETCAYKLGKTKMRLECIFEPGMSGSPVFADTSSGRKLVAVVSAKTNSFSLAALPDPQANFACKP